LSIRAVGGLDRVAIRTLPRCSTATDPVMVQPFRRRRSQPPVRRRFEEEDSTADGLESMRPTCE
jgi:hypothetical protein